MVAAFLAIVGILVFVGGDVVVVAVASVKLPEYPGFNRVVPVIPFTRILYVTPLESPVKDTKLFVVAVSLDQVPPCPFIYV